MTPQRNGKNRMMQDAERVADLERGLGSCTCETLGTCPSCTAVAADRTTDTLAASGPRFIYEPIEKTRPRSTANRISAVGRFEREHDLPRPGARP